MYKPFFEKVEELTQNNQIAINKKFIEEAKTGRSQEIIKIFNKMAGSNFNYGYRSYKFKNIDVLRMIEYNEYSYIPFYDPRDAFKKMNQSEIHKLYWLSKK
jgi:hypothetical protein